MGSSHSAPRRDRANNRRRWSHQSGERRSRRRFQNAQPEMNPNDEQGDHSLSWPVEDELPALLDEMAGTQASRTTSRTSLRHEGKARARRRTTREEAQRHNYEMPDSQGLEDTGNSFNGLDSSQSLKGNDYDLHQESFCNDYGDDVTDSLLTPSQVHKAQRKAVSIGMTGEVSSNLLQDSPQNKPYAPLSSTLTPERDSESESDISKEDDIEPEMPSLPASPPEAVSSIPVFISPLQTHSHPPATVHSVPPTYMDQNQSFSSFPEAPPLIMTVPEFFPQGSRYNEWMGRTLETLILGYGRPAPILCLPEDEDDRGDDLSVWGATRRRSTVSTIGSDFGHRSSLGSFTGNRRGSLVGGGNMHGGTLANYYNRRRTNDSNSSRHNSNASGGSTRGPPANRRGSASHGPSYRRRMSMTQRGDGLPEDGRPMSTNGGPSIALSLLARETTGRLTSRNMQAPAARLRALGGHALFGALDRPAGGMCSEVAFLSEVIDSGDWAETQTVVTRISPRLIGDPSLAHGQTSTGPTIDDPNLPPTASPHYAGGGRLGLERDAFVLAGGVEVLLRIFREPSFVGAEMARTYDARDLSEELVTNRLAPCWNETMACLRELVYSIPSLVENEIIFDGGEFVPFLFTLLSHDSCFDGAASLIEEILSLQSHSPPQTSPDNDPLTDTPDGYAPTIRQSAPTTFFLGNVPDLYKLWNGFNCRQLAHFCRILALLVFEPEDRQLLESPAVLKSIELLQLRRNRAARAGRDSTVDMNQAILLGDEELTSRLLKLLRVMNFAPIVRRSSAYHVLAQFPFIADTLVMLGLNELDSWEEIDRLETLARKISTESGEDLPLSEFGAVADVLERLSATLTRENPSNHLGNIIHVISAAQQAGVVVGSARQGRHRRRGRGSEREAQDPSDESGNRSMNPMEALASPEAILSDQVMVRRLYQGPEIEANDRTTNDPSVVGMSYDGNVALGGALPGQQAGGSRRNRVSTPDDAANALQFNALLLGPYQVEVLFVLCTLLGGRRKIDAQEMLNEAGVIPILDDTFQRLPWDSLTPSRQPISHRSSENENGSDNRNGQPNGIHGPGCECTPESALCVQYLRLVHNFCDRDCDNYRGRRLLLSDEERNVIFETPDDNDYNISSLRPGLLSKIIVAFIGESDESPYRFWLASCVESFLRGSSQSEQIFVARSGLLKHLINDITSQRLHCAGSLQTSFDLLGELCKGNGEVLHLLVTDLDEESFRKLMSVAAANLVDSNVFIRSLLLSLERISSSSSLMPAHLDTDMFLGRPDAWRGSNGIFSRSYLSHSWWDSCLLQTGLAGDSKLETPSGESQSDDQRQSDWFPTLGTINAYSMRPPETTDQPSVGLHDGVGHFGWVFTPEGESLSEAAHAPNTVERLSWFLAANQTRLLRDLLGVVDLRNINHEKYLLLEYRGCDCDFCVSAATAAHTVG